MKSQLQKRIVSAIIFLLIFLLGIANKWLFMVVFSSFIVIMLKEFINFAKIKGYSPLQSAIYILGILTFIEFFLIAQQIVSINAILIIIGGIFLLFVAELFRQTNSPIENISFSILALVYISLPFSLLNFLVFTPQNPHSFDFKLILIYYVLIWVTDIGAYFVGSILGKHPLFKRFSPKKTIEGFIGGATATYLIAFLTAYLFNFFSFHNAFWFASIVIIFGTIGDLVESMFKRSVNLKDSGNIMPGHGGLLDRFDSSLLSIPFIVLYLYF